MAASTMTDRAHRPSNPVPLPRCVPSVTLASISAGISILAVLAGIAAFVFHPDQILRSNVTYTVNVDGEMTLSPTGGEWRPTAGDTCMVGRMTRATVLGWSWTGGYLVRQDTADPAYVAIGYCPAGAVGSIGWRGLRERRWTEAPQSPPGGGRVP